MVEIAEEGIRQNASNSQIYGQMQAVFIEVDCSPVVCSLLHVFPLIKHIILYNNPQKLQLIHCAGNCS